MLRLSPLVAEHLILHWCHHCASLVRQLLLDPMNVFSQMFLGNTISMKTACLSDFYNIIIRSLNYPIAICAVIIL